MSLVSWLRQLTRDPVRPVEPAVVAAHQARSQLMASARKLEQALDQVREESRGR